VQNIILRDVTAQDIDAQVTKVLRGLGNPEPPLRLEEVRELLRLDRHYYSSTEDGVLREVISRLMVAGRQVMARPAFLGEAIVEASDQLTDASRPPSRIWHHSQ